MNKPLMIGLGAAAVGVLLLATRRSGAATGPTTTDPATPRTAIVTASPGIIARTLPSTTAPMIAPEGVSPNDAFTGKTVQVLETGLPSSDGSAGEWWRIVTPGGGTGFARAVDGGGNHNFTEPV